MRVREFVQALSGGARKVAHGANWALYRVDGCGLMQVIADQDGTRYERIAECCRRASRVCGVVHETPFRLVDGIVLSFDGRIPRPSEWRFSHYEQVQAALRGLHQAGVLLNGDARVALNAAGQAFIYDLSESQVVSVVPQPLLSADLCQAVGGWLARQGYPASDRIQSGRLATAEGERVNGRDMVLASLWEAPEWVEATAHICGQTGATTSQEGRGAIVTHGFG